MNSTLIHLVGKLKLAYKTNEYSFIVRSSVLTLRILHLLQEEGIIQNYTFILSTKKADVGAGYVKVYLKYYKVNLYVRQ